jgi:uncharacterized peroxidase-related enzyme
MMAAEYHLTLPAVDIGDAAPRARALLERLSEEIGFVPNMHARLANSPGLLEAYLNGSKSFREASGFSPAEQAVVVLTIARFNDCRYCMAAHSFVADQHPDIAPEVIEAIRKRNTIPDVKLSMLSVFTEIMTESQGKPAKHDVDVFIKAGFSERHILEIILAIAVNTISNFANHVFHTEVDAVFRDRTWHGS